MQISVERMKEEKRLEHGCSREGGERGHMTSFSPKFT